MQVNHTGFSPRLLGAGWPQTNQPLGPHSGCVHVNITSPSLPPRQKRYIIQVFKCAVFQSHWGWRGLCSQSFPLFWLVISSSPKSWVLMLSNTAADKNVEGKGKAGVDIDEGGKCRRSLDPSRYQQGGWGPGCGAQPQGVQCRGHQHLTTTLSHTLCRWCHKLSHIHNRALSYHFILFIFF